jgi:hypothetical protein
MRQSGERMNRGNLLLDIQCVFCAYFGLLVGLAFVEIVWIRHPAHAPPPLYYLASLALCVASVAAGAAVHWRKKSGRPLALAAASLWIGAGLAIAAGSDLLALTASPARRV